MAGTAMTVTIPGTPPRELSPNARVHWQLKARYTKVYRVMAYLATLAAGRVAFDGEAPIRLRVTYAWEKGRKVVDDDSAWALFKAGRDGIADALEVNDRRFRCGSVEQVRDPAGVGFTTVALWQEGVEGVGGGTADGPDRVCQGKLRDQRTGHDEVGIRCVGAAARHRVRDRATCPRCSQEGGDG